MPTIVVIDASFALAMFLPHPKQASALAAYDELRVAEVTLIAPTLWLYEVTSGVQKLAHFKEITGDQAEIAFALLANFAIDLIPPDFESARRALAWSQRLRRASAYDSFYLALADTHGCELWTADSRLANAVNESWVKMLA